MAFEVDDFETSPGLEDDPGRPVAEWPGELTLAELVDLEAIRLDGYDTEAGDLMARALRDLASEIRWTRATTPADYGARISLWNEWVRDNEFAGCDN
jgi:hypothetical protein